MAMSSAAFVWGATVVASFSLVLYADAQTIDQYGPQGVGFQQANDYAAIKCVGSPLKLVAPYERFN
ncbi:hypothetical protein Tcan_14979 [Toxocara canis]|uniref:Uncharacterized protein n=1 Tax=Toxocara canis TaxID=6265 RepID=A0A0B2W2L0_TOXCA|nr:hypothetical protein Tcan_14979 [Toxocara canis]